MLSPMRLGNDIVAAPTPIDPGEAVHEIEEAERAARAARGQVKTASRELVYRHLRLLAARKGVAPWLAALVTGSALAFALALIGIFIFNTGAALLTSAVFVAYAAASAAGFWLLRDAKEETNQNRVDVRMESCRIARERRNAARVAISFKEAALNTAHKRLRAIQELLQSEAHRRQVETARLLAIDPGRLYPDEFERYVGDVFRHLGFTIDVTGKPGDQGVDVVVQKGPLRHAIQAKRHIGSVGNDAVQEIFAGMVHRGCGRCMVVTTGTYTPSARALAESTGCVLIDCEQIPALIRGELGL